MPQQEGQIIPDLRTGCIRARPCQITRWFSILYSSPPTSLPAFLPAVSADRVLRSRCARETAAKNRRRDANRRLHVAQVCAKRAAINGPRSLIKPNLCTDATMLQITVSITLGVLFAVNATVIHAIHTRYIRRFARVLAPRDNTRVFSVCNHFSHMYTTIGSSIFLTFVRA